MNFNFVRLAQDFSYLGPKIFLGQRFNESFISFIILKTAKMIKTILEALIWNQL